MGVGVKRRQFLGLIGAAAAVWPLSAHARQFKRAQTRIPKIGVIWHAGSQSEEGLYFSALVQGFKDIGYVEGKTVHFEHRYAAEQYDRFPAQIRELLKIEVDILIASVKPAAIAAQRLTDKVPIVFVVVPDPVESKLVASLARPGGNITGLSNMSIELGAKRLEIIKEAVSGLARIALFVNTNDAITSNRFIKENQAAAANLKIDLVPVELRTPSDLDRAFVVAVERRADAVVPVIDPMFFNERERLAKLALEHRLPTMVPNLDMVDAGALMAFGPNHAALFRRSARLADKILKGESPGNIPVEQPTVFELRINLQTAKKIGLTVPQLLLSRADKVIE